MSHNSPTPSTPADQPVPNAANAPAVLDAVPANGQKSPELPKPSRLPKAKHGGRSTRILVPAGIVVVLIVIASTWFFWFRGPQARADLVTARAEIRSLQLKVVERGTLEAKDNHDVKCEVKAGSRGAPKILWVVENGTQVKKGEQIAIIDDSYLQEQATNQKILRDKAEADKIAAEQNYPILKSAIGLADKNLKMWIKGTFPQQKHDLEGQIQKAESDVLQQEDRTAWVARMVKKTYMTASQLEAEQANLTSYKLTLQQKQELLKVLVDFTDPVNREDLENKLTKSKNDEAAGLADMESKVAVFKQQDAMYKDLLEQIKQCKVLAPHSGIVVYTVPEQTRTGSGANQSIIAQGEPVQYGQKMMSIPDLSHMLVNVRIHEAFINHMKVGLPVTVRVDAVPGKTFKGHVKSVANVASPQDWMSPDVKVYQAYVEIDENVESLKLKPGLSAVSTIFTDTRATDVLAVPVQAVVSPLERDGKPRVFVQTPRGPEPREVELGMTDEKYVEIKGGNLKEGEEIVLNPKVLLSDKEKKGVKEDEKIMPTGKQGKGGGPEGGRAKDSFPGGK
jgi:multidrug efflux pump subunit AcrA (membrane-fusion protein)